MDFLLWSYSKNLIGCSFLKVESERIWRNFYCYIKIHWSNLCFEYFTKNYFVTLYIVGWKILIHWVMRSPKYWHISLYNIKKLHLLIPSISSKEPLALGSCQAHSRGYVSKILFLLKAYILSLSTNSCFPWSDRVTYFMFKKMSAKYPCLLSENGVSSAVANWCLDAHVLSFETLLYGDASRVLPVWIQRSLPRRVCSPGWTFSKSVHSSASSSALPHSCVKAAPPTPAGTGSKHTEKSSFYPLLLLCHRCKCQLAKKGKYVLALLWE